MKPSPKTKHKEAKPITAQPLGYPFTTLAVGDVSQSFAIGHGVYRREPCQDSDQIAYDYGVDDNAWND